MSKESKGRSGGKQPVWDVLAGLAAAVGQVTQITALLIPFLSDRELVSRISDQVKFNRLAGTLDRDIRQMTVRYNDIRDCHRDKRGGTHNQTEWLDSINLSEQYIAWAGDFDAVVIPTFLDMLTLLKEAGANVDSLQVPTATAAVQSSPGF